MTAQQLALNAAKSTAPYIGILTTAVCHQLELAFVAQWIAGQDESIPATSVLATANAAMDTLRAQFAKTAA